MTAVVSLSVQTRDRLHCHLKASAVMTAASARFASKAFGALFEWVVRVFEAACTGRAALHGAQSPEMVAVLAASNSSSNSGSDGGGDSAGRGLQVDIRDEVMHVV